LWCNQSIYSPCHRTYPIVPSPPHRNSLLPKKLEIMHP
jgi:hypothetical protein